MTCDSKRVRGLHFKVTEGISFRYASPELFRLYSSKDPSPVETGDPILLFKSDVWAFGVILWQLVERASLPWRSCSFAVVQSKTLGGETLAISNHSSALSVKYKVLMESMWRMDPKERPSFEVIKNSV